MKYFLVNNNYHVYDVQHHISADDEYKIIAIPHTLTTDTIKDIGVDYYWFESPFLDEPSSYLNPIVINKCKSLIKKKLELHRNDELFIYTEEEWLNHYIVHLFNKKGCIIHILEDAAIVNATKFALKTEKLMLLKIIQLFLIKLLWGFKNSSYFVVDGRATPRLADSLFSTFRCYLSIKHSRKITTKVIPREEAVITDLNEKTILFLNEDIYNFYTDFPIYLEELFLMLNSFSNNFETVYFKFHPRETDIVRKKITEKTYHIKNLIILTDNRPVELLYSSIKPKFVASYSSAGLINAYFKGLIPIFVFHLCNSLKRSKSNNHISRILENCNYNFPVSFETIDPLYSTGKLC